MANPVDSHILPSNFDGAGWYRMQEWRSVCKNLAVAVGLPKVLLSKTFEGPGIAEKKSVLRQKRKVEGLDPYQDQDLTSTNHLTQHLRKQACNNVCIITNLLITSAAYSLYTVRLLIINR